MRLGQVLIQEGLINEDQLNRALDAQLVCGGHLGTNLIELGYIDVVTLGLTLAEAFKVKPVHRDMIQSVAPDVIGLISHKLVKRHQVIPFALRDRTLHVAMINPNNLLALDELSFATGYKIETWIAPEVLIVNAMDVYYDIWPRIRHIAVSGQSPIPPVAASPREGSVAAAPSPSQPAPCPLREEHASTEPTGSRDEFVAQPSPRFGDAAQRATTPRSSAIARWTKIKKQGTQQATWTDIFDVDPNHEHFDNLEGVYVVWHKGEHPVLRVGQGLIAEVLEDLKNELDVIQAGKQSEVHVTWADIDILERNGVERYLVEMLNPTLQEHLLDATPIEIDLPR